MNFQPYLFYTLALRSVYTYVVNQQIHSDKTSFVLY